MRIIDAKLSIKEDTFQPILTITLETPIEAMRSDHESMNENVAQLIGEKILAAFAEYRNQVGDQRLITTTMTDRS